MFQAKVWGMRAFFVFTGLRFLRRADFVSLGSACNSPLPPQLSSALRNGKEMVPCSDPLNSNAPAEKNSGPTPVKEERHPFAGNSHEAPSAHRCLPALC
jgi:hypothetical protein